MSMQSTLLQRSEKMTKFSQPLTSEEQFAFQRRDVLTIPFNSELGKTRRFGARPPYLADMANTCRESAWNLCGVNVSAR